MSNYQSAQDQAVSRIEAGENVYLVALELVQAHPGTGGQGALAKAVLSIYDDNHAFSPGEILGPLDEQYTRVVLALWAAYAAKGETAELRRAGEYCYGNFPRLVELSNAMYDARCDVRRRWDEEREEENRRLYPEEYR